MSPMASYSRISIEIVGVVVGNHVAGLVHMDDLDDDKYIDNVCVLLKEINWKTMNRIRMMMIRSMMLNKCLMMMMNDCCYLMNFEQYERVKMRLNELFDELLAYLMMNLEMYDDNHDYLSRNLYKYLKNIKIDLHTYIRRKMNIKPIDDCS